MNEKSLEYFKNRLSKTLSDKRREAYRDAMEALEKARNERWIPASKPPKDGAEVLVELGYTYESDYTFYSIARFIRFEDREEHWCDNKAGYLEWDKYSDGHGGSSSYKVLRWMPLPKLKGVNKDGRAEN